MKAVALLLACVTFSPAAPLAEPRVVTTDYHGTKVEDPYRYFEERGNAEVAAWAKGFSEETFAKLVELPDRARIAGILEEAGKSQGDRVGWVVEPLPEHYFFMMRRPADEIELLFFQKPGGKPEILLDPRKIVDGQGSPVTIKYFSVSPDLKWLATAITSGGGENASLYVIDLATGKIVEGPYDRARWGPPQWLPDSSGFFYNRLQKLGPDSDPLQTFQKSMVYLHRLGTAEAEDRVVFGHGVNGDVEVKPEDIIFVEATADGRWAVALNETGVSEDYIFHVAPLAGVISGKPAWKKLTDRKNLSSDIDVRGDAAYMISREGAPNGKLVRMALEGPDAGKTTVIHSPASGVLKQFVTRADGIYLRVLDGGPSRLYRLPWAATDGPETIATPEAGRISLHGGLPAYAEQGGVSFSLGSWTRPQRLMRVKAGEPVAALLDLPQLAEPAISKDLVSFENLMPGHDGVAIPVSIIMPRTLTKGGKHPVMLNAYGAYGINIEPGFNAVDAALFEMGGIKVVAHVRGGGELGDAWRLAGKEKTKPNTWKDTISVAEGLVKAGITTPRQICVHGRSAGGITAGRALTEKPEAIGAALIGVGCLDAVRMENTPNGIPNIPEFGSVVTKEGFEALYEMSAYHHVKDGGKYPPVLLYHGANDTRVELWQSLKMAARLAAAQGANADVLLRVDYQLGHGSGGSRKQEIDLNADMLAFFFSRCR